MQPLCCNTLAEASDIFGTHKFLPDHSIAEARICVCQPQLHHMLTTYHSTLPTCHIWLATPVSPLWSHRDAQEPWIRSERRLIPSAP